MTPGKTRLCPHCRTTILDSAAVCPACGHHLRFDSASLERMQPVATPLKVEGAIRHPPEGGAWEYSIMLIVSNERGEEISRQVVGVGALQPSEQRTFSLTVDMFAPRQGVRGAARPVEEHAAAAPAAATGTGFASLFRDPRQRPAAGPSPGAPGGPPPLPRDPRPPAQQSQVRVFPAGTLAPKIVSPKPPGKDD